MWVRVYGGGVLVFKIRLFYLQIATGTHWTEDFMGAKVRLDVVDKRKSLVPAGNRASARQSSHYIAYVTIE